MNKLSEVELLKKVVPRALIQILFSILLFELLYLLLDVKFVYSVVKFFFFEENESTFLLIELKADSVCI